MTASIPYRRYWIARTKAEGHTGTWRFWHMDYGGPDDERIGGAPTLEAAFRAIDALEGVCEGNA